MGKIYISGGRTGTAIGIRSKDLKEVIKAEYADIVQ